MNVVVLRGTLSRPAEERTLPSGDRLVALEVTVRHPDAPTATVPVIWMEAPASAAILAAGTQVVVTGRVRRRFFRAGGVTASRTEVVAERVVPASRRATANKAVRHAVAALEEATAT